MSPAGALGFGSCCCDVTRENSALQQISVNGKEALEKKLRKRTNYTQGRPHRIRNCRGDSPKISWQITDTNTSFALLGSAYLDCCRATAEDGFFNWFNPFVRYLDSSKL